MPSSAPTAGPPDADARPSGSGSSTRGRRRREQLVRAGIELLGESGWAALTTRAIAERGGANPGLVHYYWDGLPGLRAEIAQRALGDAVDPALQLLTSSGSWSEGLAAVVRAGGAPTAAQTRTSTEIMAASLRDPVVAALVRETLVRARTRVHAWLTAVGTAEPEGTAVLLLATLDGLLLHRLVDPELPLEAAAGAADQLGQDTTPRPSAGRSSASSRPAIRDRDRSESSDEG